MTVEMSRLQERKQKNKKNPRNVEMWIRVPEFFLFWGIARGKTDMVGPTMHTISLVKVLVGYRPPLLSVRIHVRVENILILELRPSPKRCPASLPLCTYT